MSNSLKSICQNGSVGNRLSVTVRQFDIVSGFAVDIAVRIAYTVLKYIAFLNGRFFCRTGNPLGKPSRIGGVLFYTCNIIEIFLSIRRITNEKFCIINIRTYYITFGIFNRKTKRNFVYDFIP